MGDTWGISGPTFLLAYVVLAAVVLIAAVRARRGVAKSDRTEPVSGISTRPHDVAYLNGGDTLTYTSVAVGAAEAVLPASAAAAKNNKGGRMLDLTDSRPNRQQTHWCRRAWRNGGWTPRLASCRPG